MARFCQKCGAPLGEDSVFCTRCGTRYVEEAPVNPVPQVPNNQPPYQQQPAAPVNRAEYPQPAAPVNRSEYPQPAAPVNRAEYPQPAVPNNRPNYQPAAPVNRVDYQQQPYGAPAQTMTKPKGKFPLKWVIIGGSALLVVVIVLIIIFSLGGGAKGAFKSYFNASKNLNVKSMANVSYEANFDNSLTKQQQIDQAQSWLDAAKASAPEEYKATEQKLKNAKYQDLVDNKLTKEEIEEQKRSLAYSYKDTDKIKDIHELKYTVTYDGETSQGSCYAIKVGSKWYIHSFNDLVY